MAPRRRDFGDISERLLKLSLETNVPEPYPVTDKITVTPPTKKRGEELRESHMSLLVYQTLLNALLSRTSAERPVQPTAPDEPGEDATAEQVAAHAEAVAVHEKAVADWETSVAEWDEQQKTSEAQMNELAERVKAAEQQYNHAFFGDAHDDVMAFFDGQPQALWDAFIEDIKAEFLGAVKPPPDGTCPTCRKVVDEEEAGKAQSSSISSNVTGIRSKETSPSTSTEPTPETGSAATDPGPNS